MKGRVSCRADNGIEVDQFLGNIFYLFFFHGKYRKKVDAFASTFIELLNDFERLEDAGKLFYRDVYLFFGVGSHQCKT